MYSPQEIFEENVVKLNERWIEFANQADLVPGLFDELYRETLKTVVDFRWTSTDSESELKFKNTLSKIQTYLDIHKESDMLEMIEGVKNLKWNDPTMSALLTGKLFSRIIKTVSVEKKLLAEKDDVIQARIEALLQLLENTNNEESSMMILNTLETYKKFIICETEMQNKVTSKTVDSLVKALLVIFCDRKEFDHLNSMIKFLPRRRKMQFLTDELRSVGEKRGSNRLHNRRMFICSAILQHIFQSVFRKPREQQKILMFNLYINLIIDLAKKEKFIDLQLEKILLSANDMNVISDYYYLAADMLRLNMPNQHEDLVVKLISVGLSHDLTNLEQIKYTKESGILKWNENDFIAVHRKMFLALATLGFIIKDYGLRRLCIQMASICEPDTSFCSKILSLLPECEPFNINDMPHMNKTLLKLREQLETFQSAIKSNVVLPRTWEKASVLCYENLDFINGRSVLKDDLEPLVYPGVEKFLKRPQLDGSEEADQAETKEPLNLKQLLTESNDFTELISDRLKGIKAFIKEEPEPMNPSEVTAVMINVLYNSPDFKIVEGKILMKLSRETPPEETFTKDVTNHFFWLNEEHQKSSKPNLFFDFDLSEVEDPKCKINSMFLDGVVRVNNLSEMCCSMFEIESIMLYAIMEKKRGFSHEEFAAFNKNKNYEDTQSKIQGAFNVMMFHPIPQFGRLQKLVKLGHFYNSMFQYLCENYKFNATPGKYRCMKLKTKGGDENEMSGEMNELDDTLDDSNVEQGKELKSVIKKPPRSTSKIPKPIRTKLSRNGVSSRVPGRQVKLKNPSAKQVRKRDYEYPTLVNGETFHASDELLETFTTIQRALNEIIGEHGLFDLKQLVDSSSPHKVMFTYETTSELIVTVYKKRNSRTVPTITKKFEVPARLHGSLTVHADIIDELVYDENNDNPTVKSTSQLKIKGNFALDHMSHIIKNIDLDFVVNNCRFTLKFTLRSGSRGYYKCMSGDGASGSDKEGSVIRSTHKRKSITISTSDAGSKPMKSRSTIKSRVQKNQQHHGQPIFQDNQQPKPINLPPIQQTPIPVFDPMMPATYPQPSSPVPIKYEIVQPAEEHQCHFFRASSPTQLSQLPLNEHQAVELVENTRTNSQVEHPTVIVTRRAVQSPIKNDHETIEHHESKKPRYDQDELLVAAILANSANPDLPQEQAHQLIESNLNIKQEIIPSTPKIEPQPSLPFIMREEKVPVLETEDISPSQLFADPIEMMTGMFTDHSAISEQCNTPKSAMTDNQLLNINDEPELLTQNGHETKTERMNDISLDESEIDFEAQILPVVHLFNPNVRKAPEIEQTPPTSPPPLHYRKPEEENSYKVFRNGSDEIMNGKVKQESFHHEPSAGKILNNTPPDEDEDKDVIDLTDEVVVDLTSEDMEPVRLLPYKPSPASKKITPMHSVTTYCSTMTEKSRLIKKVGTKNYRSHQNGPKRQRLSSVDSMEDIEVPQTRESEVRVLNVMENINKALLKPEMKVTANVVRLKLPPGRQAYNTTRTDYVISSCEEEQPLEGPLGIVTHATQSTFHIVYQNCVSYSSIDKQSGDGFAKKLTANNQGNEKFSCKPNLLKNLLLNNANVNTKGDLKLSNSYYVDNIANDKVLEKFSNVNLTKTIYSDKNCFNFTKNLKNSKKFCQWSPKLNNDQQADKYSEKLDAKEVVEDEKKLLCQLSDRIFNLIPGLNSLEFFEFPSTPRRSIHVKVIHVYKDLKNGDSSTSCDSSDTDDEQNHETISLTESFNGESSGHVQKIGQTSINRESDLKTIQTSFGSIIKNTYPPATLSTRIGNGTEIVKSLDKEQQKYAKLKSDEVQIKKIISHEMNSTGKPSSNIKIVACTSNSSQVEPQKPNRNQTLINMLTQQVMLPANSNRHFIITSNKADVVKTDSNITTVTSALPSHQIVARKVVTSQGQSQLVQILNSPPSSFTMKSIGTSVATSPAKLPNQIVTAVSQATNNTFKAELPATAKQQGIVQFICKTDGKIIHLTPICNNAAGGSQKKITYKVDTSGAKGPTILHHANQQIIINNPLKKSDNQNILTIIQKQDDGDKKKSPMLTVSQPPSTPTSPISTRSIYEETYAKFIQTSSSSKSSDMGLLTISSSPINTPITSATSSSIIQKIGKTVIQSSNQVLPKFNQAFGKAIFTTNTSVTDQTKNKTVSSKEILTSRQMTVSFADSKPITKVTRTVSELKSTDANTLLSLIESEGTEKSLPALQTALQNNMLYARPIGNGKLLASNNNNVLLTALRGNNQSNNVRIITSISENINRSSGAIMAPMRISVPIQIPKLVNTNVRQQAPSNFRQQIVIATTPTRMQQTINNQQVCSKLGSKLESLLMTTQPTTVKREVEVGQHHQIKFEAKPKKNVDHSTLEQLREFDMVLEQVLERSSSEVTATSMSSPPTPDNSNHLSPKKQLTVETKIKTEMKLNAVTTITSISPSVSPSPKSAAANVAKAVPKLQEDEHTAQRILDILANYKEQVRNSPDLNNKPAPRRRANPPTNPPAAKRKKVVASGSIGSIKSSSKFGSTSDMMTDTMGSEEDSSCGMGSGVASTGSMNNSPQPQDIDDQTDVSMDNNFYMEDSKRETALSPQSSSSSVATSPSHNKFPVSRRLILTETKTNPGSEINPNLGKNLVITSSQPQATSSASLGTSIERLAGHGSTAAVLMPGNYLLPMNVLKGGQQLAILSSNNGQKIIAVPTNQLVGNSCGTSIILQRYLNQASEMGNKTVLTSSDGSQNAFKSVRLQQNPSITYLNHKSNASGPSSNTLYIRPIHNMNQSMTDTQTLISNHPNLVKQEDNVIKDFQNSKFVSDKTLITEIIQQQQQLSHTHQHPQQNFMIKLNEHQPSDPRSSSSIMFVSNSNPTSSFAESKEVAFDKPKIKIEEIDYDDYMKEDAIDLLNETEEMAKSPMLNTKIEVDDNTNSNYESNNLIYDDSVVKMENEQDQKFQHFPIVLSSNHGKAMGVSHVSTSTNIKGFLIDPTNKIVMYNDRKPATIEKEFFNQKSFSEECADLGVDEPVASDLFPEADLLFDSGSPKFDQINSHDGAMHIKKELENGQVLLEMNYNHNMETESWLNFDTEEELVDGTHVIDDIKDVGGGGGSGHSGDLKAYF